ncbi:MAG: aspartate--tRNA ligase, partial [Acidimicrobiia bacterium]
MRTHLAGELRDTEIGSRVQVAGWVAHRRDHGGVVFLDVRDVSGIVQVVLDPGHEAVAAAASALRSEWVVSVSGLVRARPDGTVNADLPTGAVEIAADEVDILNEAEALPFSMDDRVEIDEALRLKYRYLDIRRGRVAANLRVRARVNAAIRQAMDAQSFCEVETPILIASTPEGARDFVVPARQHPGLFYALPQSPQLFKQLLMVAGMDRYYQIARCLRDEDLRADRQFEFMQLDAEMSFATGEDVRAAIGRAVVEAVNAAGFVAPSAIPTITWREAMNRFGSDKPDMRFGMELTDLKGVFAKTEFRAFQAPTVVGICVPEHGDVSRSRLDALTENAKRLGAAGLVWMRVQADSIDSPVAKFLSDTERDELRTTLNANTGDLILIVAGEWKTSVEVLGALRLELGKPLAVAGLHFSWVVDFPMFEALGADGNPIPAHHPFTKPRDEDLHLLDGSGPALLEIRAQAYDLVLNGWELGSGSVRIHQRELQSRIFELLGIDSETAQERFGFLLDAFRYGAPPHA